MKGSTRPTVIIVTLVLSVSLLAACAPPMEIAESDLRTTAVVAPIPPPALCKNEPRELGGVPVDPQGNVAARLVRSEKSAILLRVLPGANDAPAKLQIDSISRSGEATKIGETTETGRPGKLLGLDVVVGGGHLQVALTRPEGRVDVLCLENDGTTVTPPRTLELPGVLSASLLWHGGAALLFADGALLNLDGTPHALLSPSSPDTSADAGASNNSLADEGDGRPQPTPTLPSGVRQIVSADETLGWLRVDDEGWHLDHLLLEKRTIITVPVAPASHEDVRLLWASDRYIVGDSDGADIARFIIATPRGRNHEGRQFLRLGGRMNLPRGHLPPAWSAWDGAGARHIGIAQPLAARHLRFVNVALGGLVFDPEAHIRRDRDLTRAQVLWDGRGYILLWGERESDNVHQLVLTRFSCPDEG